MIELFWLLTIICAAFTLGKSVVYWFKIQFNSLLEEIILYSAMGLGILSFITLAVGLCGLFYPSIFRILVLILDIIFIYNLKTLLPKLKKITIKKPADLFSIFLVIIFAIAILFTFLKAYKPPVEGDVLLKHLTLPKYYIQHHKISNLSKIAFPEAEPQLIRMLYVVGMLLHSDIIAQLMMSLFTLLTALSIYLMTRQFITPQISLLGICLFYSLPVVLVESGTAMVDMGLPFYGIISVYTCLRWVESLEKKWLIITAIMCGFALGTKYNGGLCLLVPLVGIIFRVIKGIKKELVVKMFASVILFGIVYGVIISPWLIKNYLYTGNPVSIFMYDVFGGSNWNAYLENLHKSVSKAKKRLFLKDIKEEFKKEPIRSWHNILYHGLQYLPLLFFIFLLFLSFRNNPINLNFILVYSLVYFFIGNAVHSIYPRYLLLPLSPHLSILAAYSITKLMLKNRLFKNICLSMTILLIVSWWTYGYAYLTYRKSTHTSIKVIFGFESRNAYLSRVLDCYTMSTYINTHLSSSDRILSLNECRYYYFNPYFVPSCESVLGTIVHTSKDINEIIKCLKKNFIYYLFINRNEYFTHHSSPTILQNEKILNKYFNLLYTNKVCYLYKIK